MSRRPSLLLLLHLTLAVFGASVLFAAPQADELSKESKLKAAYLLNFTKFIEWPDSPAGSNAVPLRICLQEDTPFEVFFTDLVADRKNSRDRRSIVIHQLSNVSQCHLAYLHQKEVGHRSKAEHEITVLDSSKIPHEDAVILFYIKDRKLRFEIDVSRAESKGVSISSELLKLARIK